MNSRQMPDCRNREINIAQNIVRKGRKIPLEVQIASQEQRSKEEIITVAPLPKGVPLPDHISDTGVREDNFQKEFASTFSDCHVQRVKHPGNSPLRTRNLTLEN